MFDLIGKALGSLFGTSLKRGEESLSHAVETAVEIHLQAAGDREHAHYRVAASRWPWRHGFAVYHDATGGIAAVTSTSEQAQTLCDTLNLACGEPPSRKLLDAIHQRCGAL